jgi:Enterobacterial TraT complement resistance protein
MRLAAPRRAVAVASLCLLAGCAATTTAISERNLDVQTKMSDSIFLDPVAPDRRTVFVQVRNTSDRPDFDIEQEVRAAVAERGYRVVEDPDKAQYMLQANVLQAGRTSKSAAEATFGSGFGGVVLGGAVGAAAGRAVSRDTSVIIAGGLLGAAAESVTSAFVQDVTYGITTDVQVSERAREGVVVTERLQQNLGQGASGSEVLSSTETTDWKRYQTRVQSTASKANLEFEEAAPELTSGLTRSIAGIF